MEILTAPAQALVDTVCLLLERWPMAGQWYMAFIRFVFPVLAILIVFRAVRSLLRIPHTPETWGQLSLPNGTPILLTHWENIIGRSKNADVYLN